MMNGLPSNPLYNKTVSKVGKLNKLHGKKLQLIGKLSINPPLLPLLLQWLLSLQMMPVRTLMTS